MKHPSAARLLAVVGAAVALSAGVAAAVQPFGLGHLLSSGHPRGITKPAQVRQMLAHLSLPFVRNDGRLDPRVAYYQQGASSGIYFTSSGVTLSAAGRLLAGAPSLSGAGPSASARPAAWAIQQGFVNGATVRPIGEARATGIASYFQGRPSQWHTGLPTFERIVYRNVWPGIDVMYTGTTSRLEYTFVVHPGADPRSIAMAYRGASSAAIDPATGRLVVSTPLGGFADQAPVAYQTAGGRRVPVSAAFQAEAAGSLGAGAFGYGFSVGPYDPSRTLIIDPVTIAYSGYIGGYLQDIGLAISIDAAGNAYVVGQTNSSQYTFPVKVGPYLKFKGQTDVFVCKVDGGAQDASKLGSLDYCGYIGGKSSDRGRGVAVDPAGEAYVYGWTRSTQNDGFPVMVGPSLKYHGGSSDAFIAKVTADGTKLLFCGYLGGGDHDEGKDVALDSSGNAYVTGGTKSNDFAEIPSSGVAQPDNAGGGDAYVIEVSNAGQAVTGTYLGGSPCTDGCKEEHSGDEHARGISVISSGPSAGVYVDGDTHSEPDSFLPVVGPSLTYGGNGDAFAARLPLNLSTFVYKGYVGGKDYEDMRDNAVDSSGDAYLCGHTASTNFPIVGGLGYTVAAGDTQGFVTKISPDGTTLVYSTVLGGSRPDSCYGISVDAGGAVYLAGHTLSPDFPVKNVGGYDAQSLGTKYSKGGDGMVAAINAAGNALLFSGYYGGAGTDVIWASALNANGQMVLTGTTHSAGGGRTPFPLFGGQDNKGAPGRIYQGAGDGFAAMIETGGGR